MKLAWNALLPRYFSLVVIFNLHFSPVSLYKNAIFFDIIINFVRVDFKSDSLISCNKVCIPVAVDGSFHLCQHTPFALSFLP